MNEKQLIEILDAAIKSHPFRPDGIKVGDAMYAAVKHLSGRVSSREVGPDPWGRTHELVLDGDIYIVSDSMLPDTKYEMPTQPGNYRNAPSF